MAQGDGKPKCAETGLTVPECSCQRCLEAMLREFRPTLLADEITITKAGRDRREGPDAGRREAA
ncbi:MAG: hypothetical protein GEU88_10740 [Solirubrobacterales bacterium]|nr:hypothetical protein [Solirubrobacterales bacterium]